MKLRAIFISICFLLALGAVIIQAEEPQTKALFTTKDVDNGKIYVIDNKEYGPYQGLRTFCFSEDGRQWVLLVSKDNKPYIVYNGKEFGPYDSLNEMRMVQLSKDGGTWYTFGQDNAGNYIIINGQKIGPYRIFTSTVFFSANGKRWAFAVQKDNSGIVVIDGKEYGSYSNEISDIFLSSNGKYWAYEASKKLGRNEVRVVVINEKEYYGDSLRYNQQGNAEYFTWITYDDNRNPVKNSLKVN